MATYEKRNVDYFPFLCKEGKAMFYIETKYGNDGYATWIKLLRQLAVTNNHWINLSDSMEMMFTAAKCKVSEGVLQNIITDLSKMGEFNEILWSENKIIYSEKFILNIQDAYSRRNNKCMQLSELCIHLKELGIHNSYNNPKRVGELPHIIVYNNIVDKSKENNTILPETSSGDSVNDLLIPKEETADTIKPVNAKLKKKKKEVDEKTKILRASCRNFFLSIYLQKFGENFEWSTKDAVAMNDLIRKLTNKVKEKIPGITDTDEHVINSFQHFLTGITDPWLIANYTLPILNGRFDPIFQQIKNPNLNSNAKSRNQQGAAEAAEFLKQFSTGI